VIPENVGKSLLNGVKKFEESKTSISGYVSTSAKPTKTTASKGQSKILTNATNASKAADGYYDKFMEQVDADEELSASEKEAKKDVFETSFAQTCSQFDTLTSKFSVSGAKRPANCAAATLTLASGEALGLHSDSFEAAESIDTDDSHVHDWAFVPEDYSLSSSSLTDDPFDSGDAASDFLDFARLGERLLRAD
jgi:hypothetical protein